MDELKQKIQKIRDRYAHILSRKETSYLYKIILILEIRYILDNPVYSKQLTDADISQLNEITEYLQQDNVNNI